ncbi:MAG: hypothetical protein K2K56_12480 [Lachnospiraceae bacterium]|nr:hypothetical protein [Lachnospiraceae bacterium]
MKRIISIFVVIIIVTGLVGYTYLSKPEMQKMVAEYTEEDFTEDNIYSDIESLSKRLEEELLTGNDFFTVYLDQLDVEAIRAINEKLDGVYGSGSTYQQVGVVGNTYKKVRITIQHSTNYYAVQACLKQTPIPDTEPKAKKLYQVIMDILDSVITEGMSDYDKELALHDYLVTHCTYSENTDQPSTSDIYRAYGALVNQNAVCNGYAEALQLLLKCVGIESEFVIGSAGGVDHAWNLVNLDGRWYHLDATWDDPVPDTREYAMHPYFNVTDEVMASNHTWNREDYPAALSASENYYKKSNNYFYNFDDYSYSAYIHMINEGNNRYEAVIENCTVEDEDMQFIFDNNNVYNTVSWQTFQAGRYCVIVVQAE